MGPQSEAAIKEMIQRASEPSTGIFAGRPVAGVTLLVGASGVFAQLQDSLNSIWGVKAKEGRGHGDSSVTASSQSRRFLEQAFYSWCHSYSSAALSAFGKWFGGWLPAPELVLQILEFIISFGVVTGLFALIFKVLPDANVAWRDVWVGSAMTALLFTIGKFAIGLYLGKSDVGSAYGAAGSMVILLVWVYYSAQSILFGAEFTQVYANALGSRIVASDNADVADPAKAKDSNSAKDSNTAGAHTPLGGDSGTKKRCGVPRTGGCHGFTRSRIRIRGTTFVVVRSGSARLIGKVRAPVKS